MIIDISCSLLSILFVNFIQNQYIIPSDLCFTEKGKIRKGRHTKCVQVLLFIFYFSGMAPLRFVQPQLFVVQQFFERIVIVVGEVC